MSEIKGWYKIENDGGIAYTPVLKSKEYDFTHFGDNFQVFKELSEKTEIVHWVDGIAKSAGIPNIDKDIALPAGAYKYEEQDYPEPERLVPIDIRKDSFAKSNPIYDRIIEDVDTFIAKEHVYRDLNIIYKRGILLYGPPGEGKCLGRGTPILMYDGTIVPVEKIKVNDLLMGDDNLPRIVLSLARGREKMYKIDFVHGGSFVANGSHILSLKTSGHDTKSKGTVVDISINEYLKLSNTEKHHLKSYMVGANFKESEKLPLPAYLLGHWLGDGSTGQAEFTTMDLPIVREYQKYADLNGLNLRLQNVKSRAGTYVLSIPNHRRLPNRAKDCNSFTVALKQLGVFNNKHIPNIALRQNKSDREQLLAGLMDSDGSTNRTAYDYCSIKEELANGVATLARSLGFRVTVKSRITHDQNGTSCLSYRVRISGQGLHEIPVRLEHKKLPIRRQKKDQSVYGFTITELPEDEYFGFEIDGNKRFLLGDFTVTHNTSLIRSIISSHVEKGAIIIFVSESIPSIKFIKKIQFTLKDKLKIFVFEELTNFFEHNKAEEALTFLDGEHSIDKSVIFATTNYPEKLPGNIVDRPSRFDKLYAIKNPDQVARGILIKHYLKRDATEEEITITDKMSTASIKESCVMSLVRDVELTESVKEMKKTSEVVKKNFSEQNKMGF